MAKTAAASAQCPMEIGLNILSGKWRLRILWQLTQGAVRFNELQRQLGAITAKTLAQQLQELERLGMIRRTVYPATPPQVEYALTAAGDSIRPVLKALCDWGKLYQTGMDASNLT